MNLWHSFGCVFFLFHIEDVNRFLNIERRKTMKYARYDIILQEKEVNEDLLIRIDNSEASGAIPLELLSHDRKEKVSGYMNFQGAKALGYNLSNKELLDKLSFLIFNTRSDSSHCQLVIRDERNLVTAAHDERYVVDAATTLTWKSGGCPGSTAPPCVTPRWAAEG